MAVVDCDLNILPVDYLSHMGWKVVSCVLIASHCRILTFAKDCPLSQPVYFGSSALKSKASRHVGAISLHVFVALTMKIAKQHKVT